MVHVCRFHRVNKKAVSHQPLKTAVFMSTMLFFWYVYGETILHTDFEVYKTPTQIRNLKFQ
jgi:hypothetical protein